MYTRYAQLRDSKGMTDYEVATKAGIPASTIYDWKQRSTQKRASLSVEHAVKIARLFGVAVEELLEANDEA